MGRCPRNPLPAGRRFGRALALALALVPVAAAWPAAAFEGVGPLQTVRSDASGLEVQLTDLQASWQMRSDGRAVLHAPGFVASGAFGAPQVPTASAWILVPPGTRPELVVTSETWGDAGGRALATVPVPVEQSGPDGPELLEIDLVPGTALPAGVTPTPAARAALDKGFAARTGAAATLGEIGWWRGRRVVPLVIGALRHDAAGRALGVLQDGRWTVRFVPDKGAVTLPATAEQRLRTTGDDHFGYGFLNPGLLRTAPTEAAWQGVAPRADKGRALRDAVLLAPEVKLAVRASRLYRVTATRLRQRGLLPDTPIQESEIRLYQRRYLPELDGGTGAPYVEVEVPIRMVGDGDAFDGDDFFVFYGLRLRDDGDYTGDLGGGPQAVPGCGDQGEWANDFNVYWLAAAEPAAGASWARMDETELPPSAGQPLPSYRRTERAEEQLFLRHNVVTTLVDRLYMNHYQDTSATVSIASQWAPDPAGAPASIGIDAAAFTTYGSTTAKRVRFDLVVDNTTTTVLGFADLMQPTDRTFTYAVDAAVLAGQTAKVVMTKDDPTGLLFSYLNGVTISYDALYRAVSNEQRFHTGAAAGPRAVEVEGFTDGDLGLVEITDPHRPVWVKLAAGNVVPAIGGSYTLSILPTQAAADQPRRFWAAGSFGTTGVAEFSYYDAVTADDPVDPTALSGGAPDVIVVTHGDFTAGVDRWVAHRKARAGGDLEVKVVDVADLYDWYSGGLKSNWAVRRFARHAIEAWGSWALVIVGDANENERGLGVLPAARGWSTDFVPTHYHVQDALTGIYEFMATDKWFVTDETGETPATDDFPDRIRSPWPMITGRLPCNSEAELDRMIDKIVAVEATAAGQDWRRRGIFVADDAFSNGYGAEALTTLVYQSGEEQFGWSERDSLTAWWGGGTPVTLDTNLLLLDTWLAPLYPGTGDRRVSDVRDDTEALATPPLRAALSQGGLIAHYQGHANAYVLASEYWYMDRLNARRDVSLLANTGKPWLYFGMGCHISDWAQNSVANRTSYNEPSLGEKVLVGTAAGASASYGSSGYEYIFQNRVFGERMFRIWTKRPPVVAAHGGAARSRWMTGELLWAAEAAHLAATWANSIDREMVAQYVLLGDPLMMLDAGPPEVTAVLEGAGGDQEIAGDVDLVGTDAANLRTIRIAARDEAGIDRLRVMDSDGVDLTSTVVVMADSLPPGQADQQEVHYRLQVPVRPFPHSIDVEVWDTGAPLPEDRHWTLTLNVDEEVAFTTGGQPVDPATFGFETDVPVDFQGSVTGAAWLHEGTTWALASDNLLLTNVVLPAGKTNDAQFSFTATAAGGTEGERSVVLTIDGHPSTWVLQAGDQPLPEAAITRVYSFPNPMREATRFLFETGAAQGRGTVRVFAVSGRVVARIPFSFGGGGAGVVEWDGRDDEGDALANGTYLYRVEMDAPGGRINSPMQRLVVMR